MQVIRRRRVPPTHCGLPIKQLAAHAPTRRGGGEQGRAVGAQDGPVGLRGGELVEEAGGGSALWLEEKMGRRKEKGRG